MSDNLDVQCLISVIMDEEREKGIQKLMLSSQCDKGTRETIKFLKADA